MYSILYPYKATGELKINCLLRQNLNGSSLFVFSFSAKKDWYRLLAQEILALKSFSDKTFRRRDILAPVGLERNDVLTST